MPPLKPLANAMRQGLDWSKQAGKTKAWNQRTLARGLQILLSYDEDKWRLALRREDVIPSEQEIEICMEAFEVPEAAARAMRSTTERHPVTGRSVKYHVCELTWREYERRTESAIMG